MNDVRLIAFYLPQFHPIEENDAWWGKGFTEWTNVSSARPVFPGHYQPHVPADLGFYDLRMEEAREEQAALARAHGIYGFCYYYYYFNGKRLLNKPLDMVLESGKPDFPFCICWANENWTRNWDGRENEILMEQVHTPESDLEFIKEIVPILSDKRYIRVNNKLLLLIYRTELLPEPQKTARLWRDHIRKELGEELYLCTVNNFVKDFDPTTAGFDGAVQFPLSVKGDCFIDTRLVAAMNQVDYEEIKDNHFVNYPSAVNQFVSLPRPEYTLFRGVLPSWDNTPRRQKASAIFLNSSPELYKLYLKAVVGLTRAEQTGDERIVFINAWNEWAEGAHLEPDKKYGLRYLQATGDALQEDTVYGEAMEEIRETDAESRKLYAAARQLTKAVVTSEQKIAELTSQQEKQQEIFAGQVSVLNGKIGELDQQVQEYGRLIQQKRALILEKETLIHQKEQLIHDQENRIHEIERFNHEQAEQQMFFRNHVKELELQIIQKERQFSEMQSRIDLLGAELTAKELFAEGQRSELAEKEDSLRRKDQVISGLETALTAREEVVQEKDRVISEKEATVAGKENLVLQKEEVIAEKDQVIAEKDQVIAEKDQVVAAKDNVILQKEHLLAARDSVIAEKESVIAAREAAIRDQARQLADQQSRNASIDRIIKEKDQLIASYINQLRNATHLINLKERAIREKNSYIHSLYNSFSWRITSPVRWAHGSVFKTFYLFFPYQSKRWSFIKNIFQPGSGEHRVRDLAEVSVTPQIVKLKKEIIVTNADQAAMTIIRASRLFDRKWYQKAYPDILKIDIDPLVHFVKFGAKEGRHPNPLFATKWYMLNYPDVAKSQVNPLIHYLQTGAAAGYNPNPLFDSLWYLKEYPNVAKAGMNPLEHYLHHGSVEKKNLLQPDQPAAITVRKFKKVAVVCHVYYPELWEQLSVAILNIPVNYELFVSVPQKGARIIRSKVLADFPNAKIKVVDNLGGDVNPFLVFLEDIHARGLRIFCKIHTKKGKTDYGDIWRAVLLHSVLGSDSIVTNILNAFDTDEKLALVGSELLYKSAKGLEYGNRQFMQKLFGLLYPDGQLPEDWGFFAGTMFWGRTETFLPIARTIHKQFKFEKARQEDDGQLAHAIERMMGAIVYRENLKTGLVRNELGIMRARKLMIHDNTVIPSMDVVGKTLIPLREMFNYAYGIDQDWNNHSEETPRVDAASPSFPKWPFVSLKWSLPFVRISSRINIPAEDIISGACKINPNGQNILLCAHSAADFLAGGEVSFLDMVHGLKSNGYNLIVILPRNNPSYIRELIGSVIRIYIVPYLYWGTSVENKSLVRKIAEIAKFEKIEAVYVNTIMIREPHKAAKILGIPSITHARELISDDETLIKVIQLSKEVIRQKVLNRSNYIIANSQATSEFYDKKECTLIVPNTIDVDAFDIKNSVDPKQIRVALISSNIPKKGIYEFIEVARICEHQVPAVRFLLIGGESEQYRELLQESTRDGFPRNIVFSGYCERPIDAVSRANIIMNLSLFSESFGRTVLEAMAARRPVVAYDFGAISELIEDGKNGFLVPYKDVAGAAEKIVELCRNPSKINAMGKHGRELAIQRFSKEIYGHLLGKAMQEIFRHWGQQKTFKKDSGKPAGSEAGETPPIPPAGRKKVSVVIPNYNYSRYLEERITSITSQTYPPSEIIFLDDMSTDDSLDVARKLLQNSPIPYRIIPNTTNQGTYRQWLKGFEEAAGDYIWIAEADDSCAATFLERLVARMEAGNMALCYSQSVRIDGEGKLLAPDNLHHTDDLSKERWKQDFTELGVREVVDYLFYRNTIPNVSACLFNKAMLSAIPEELTGYRFVGDWFLYCHLLSKGSVAYVAEPLNKFRRHAQSVTRVKSTSDEYLKELIRIKKYMVDHFPVHPRQIDGMVNFLNKDFKIAGLAKNADHKLAARFIKEIKGQVAQRKRLVFLTTNNGSYYGGSEQLWLETAVKTRKLQHDVMVIIKKWDPAPPFFSEFEELGIKFLFKETLDFGDVVRFGPDLMVISTGDQDEGTEWYDLCQKNDIPYVIINQLTKEPKYWPIRKEKIIPVTNGYLKAEKTFFTCWNNHGVMERRLGCKIPNAAVHFNPFHFDRNSVVAYPSTADGLKLAIPANLLRIHKGQHLALELFSQKKWRERPVHLNLYGKGADEEILKKMAADLRLDNVTFFQRTPDLLTIWRDNHAIFMPSFMEGLPIVLVGAMICARVPIITDIGGHREVVDDNVTGFIAQEPTVESLDEALERAYQASAKWEEMGQKARQRILAYLPENDPVDDFISKLLPVIPTKK